MIDYERGEYVIRIEDQGWTKTKKTDLPMLVFEVLPVKFITKDDEGNECFEEVYTNSNYPTRKINIVVDGSRDDMLDFAMKKLRYAGFTGDSFSDLNMVGMECRGICTHDKWDGKDIDRFDFALPPTERSTSQIDNAVARRLDALFGKRLKDGAKPAENPPEPSRTPEPQSQPQQTVPDDAGEPPFDDDVPF